MRYSRSWNNRWAWRDRVSDKSESFDADIDAIVAEALEYAQMIVECAVAPIAAMAAGLPRTMGYRGHGGRHHPHRQEPHRDADWDD